MRLVHSYRRKYCDECYKILVYNIPWNYSNIMQAKCCGDDCNYEDLDNDGSNPIDEDRRFK